MDCGNVVKNGRFLQLHLLVFHAIGNLNRDDSGRPKTAKVGGWTRMRISSQTSKFTWRTSDLFELIFKDIIGKRTRKMGTKIYEALLERGIEESTAKEWARSFVQVFTGKSKKEKEEDKKAKKGNAKSKKVVAVTEAVEDSDVEDSDFDPENVATGDVAEQLIHFSPDELNAIFSLVNTISETKQAPSPEQLSALITNPMRAVDIALFGRMLAARPEFGCEAAVQVSHAFTTNAVLLEDDYFTAVDDLDRRGAAHINETSFGSGLFYQYLCIDREMLLNNLGGNVGLAKDVLGALTECAMTVAPKGKQNPFATRACANFVLAEKGDAQPRSLALAFAFADPTNKGNFLIEAPRRLREFFKRMQRAYDTKCSTKSYTFDIMTDEGTISELVQFVKD